MKGAKYSDWARLFYQTEFDPLSTFGRPPGEGGRARREWAWSAGWRDAIDLDSPPRWVKHLFCLKEARILLAPNSSVDDHIYCSWLILKEALGDTFAGDCEWRYCDGYSRQGAQGPC
jgi:hypothetical protein